MPSEYSGGDDTSFHGGYSVCEDDETKAQDPDLIVLKIRSGMSERWRSMSDVPSR